MVSTIVPNRATAKLSTALMYGGSFTVSSVTSTPGHRNIRIRSCLNAPLKSVAVVEVEEGGIDGCFAQNAGHVLVDLAAHIAA